MIRTTKSFLVLLSLLLPSLCRLPVVRAYSDDTDDVSKPVVAHFIVGNSFPYTVDDWSRDIDLAASKGIDGFVLNVGSDSWQPDRVADAFSAAQDHGADFKLFLSFDMTSLPCAVPDHANVLRDYINTYSVHPNQFFYDGGKTFVSTFSGQNCDFGQGSVDEGWTHAVKTGLPPVYFVPGFFVDPSSFPSHSVIDGALNWNGAWPMGNNDIGFDSDNSYISNLGGRSYMATVSPCFFTHYGPRSFNKNFIYRGDDWLFSERWELLFQHRNSIAVAQVLTWNDYGESHYLGPVEGAQPNSQAWTNGFDHQAWLDLMQYYIIAFKSGKYPTMADDKIFVWARLYPAQADAPDDVGRPNNWQWTQDYLWAVVFLAAPGNVTLSCGTSMQTTPHQAGVFKLKLPLVASCSVSTSISRGGRASLVFAPSGFDFSTSPPSYNFNPFVAASP